MAGLWTSSEILFSDYFLKHIYKKYKYTQNTFYRFKPDTILFDLKLLLNTTILLVFPSL